MGNVFKFDKNCAKEEFKHCTADQINSLNGYMSDFPQGHDKFPGFFQGWQWSICRVLSRALRDADRGWV